jgi:leucyl/phenylalanyl-tRNA--protein transferase
MMEYVPEHLRKDLHYAAQEFCLSTKFDAPMIRDLMFAGFLPMAGEFGDSVYLLPKLHLKRCVVEPKNVKYSKSTWKRSKNLCLKINQRFNQVVLNCRKQHPNCWLYSPLVNAFKKIPNVVSIEVYDGEEMVAGELGYTNGAVYTSLTGFYTRSGTGMVQLLALAGLLIKKGFQLWDLGMTMDYKLDIAATEMDREAFVKQYYELRTANIDIGLKEQHQCSELISLVKPVSLDS